MGKKLAKSKKDSIEEIEIILDRETQKAEARTSKRPKTKKAPKEHRPTKHPILVSAISASFLAAVPTFLFLRYYGAITDFIKGATKKEEGTSEQQPDEPEEEKINFGTTPIVVYISGSDSRTSVQDTSARSDVNIVAVVNPTTGKILLVSTPRDYYVQLHGTTGLRDKLTHAGIYGIDMSRQTIEDLLDIKVDKTVKVGFDALETIVDAIDGIDIYSDQDLSLKSGQCKFVGGTTQHVNGACALAFSRERHSYATGDRHRGENQQQVISKILQKVTTPAYLLRLPEILRAADGLFETTFTYSEILDMIKFQLFSSPSWSIESISLDGTGSMQPTYSIPSQNLYVMIPNDATIATAQTKITQYLKTKAELEEEEAKRASEEAEAAEKAQQEVDE